MIVIRHEQIIIDNRCRLGCHLELDVPTAALQRYEVCPLPPWLQDQGLRTYAVMRMPARWLGAIVCQSQIAGAACDLATSRRAFLDVRGL